MSLFYYAYKQYHCEKLLIKLTHQQQQKELFSAQKNELQEKCASLMEVNAMAAYAKNINMHKISIKQFKNLPPEKLVS